MALNCILNDTAMAVNCILNDIATCNFYFSDYVSRLCTKTSTKAPIAVVHKQ